MGGNWERKCQKILRASQGMGSVCLSLLLGVMGDVEVDVVVVGSGVGGLSCAALCAHNKLETLVLEAHDEPGGAAHEFTVQGHRFESGPSLYAGLSTAKSPNPLAHVFQIIDEQPDWITYDRWGTFLPEGNFAAATVTVLT